MWSWGPPKVGDGGPNVVLGSPPKVGDGGPNVVLGSPPKVGDGGALEDAGGLKRDGGVLAPCSLVSWSPGSWERWVSHRGSQRGPGVPPQGG